MNKNKTLSALKTPSPKYPTGSAFAALNGSERFHWTVETFYRAVEAGIFDGTRWELINGEIVERGNMNPPHGIFVEAAYEALRRTFGDRFWLRSEKPIKIAFDGEPMPDVLLIDPARQARPSPRAERGCVTYRSGGRDESERHR